MTQAIWRTPSITAPDTQPLAVAYNHALVEVLYLLDDAALARLTVCLRLDHASAEPAQYNAGRQQGRWLAISKAEAEAADRWNRRGENPWLRCVLAGDLATRRPMTPQPEPTKADRISRAQQLLGSGITRPLVVRRLAAELGITDRQARRLVAEAEQLMPPDWHKPIEPIGSPTANVDVLAEAQRLYRWLRDNGAKPSEQISALRLVAKLQREADATQLPEQWDAALAADRISNLPPDPPF